MIAYYITSHGFGHAVRSCEVMRNLPQGVPIIVRSTVPEWFLRGELAGRDCQLAPAQFDSGTVGPDSTAVDLRMTIDHAEPLLEGSDGRARQEADWLRATGARLVVSDIAPLPLAAARLAGIPSILIGNFTWSAIYRALLPVDDPELQRRAESVIAAMDRLYARGDLLLIPGLDVPMDACRAKRRIPLIARRGSSRRDELARLLGLDLARPILLLYVGTEGRQGVRWDRLDRLKDYQLIAYRPPEGDGGCVSEVPPTFHHADVVASVDGVIAKPGYSMVAECIGSGTPVLTCPRPQFIEAAVILRELEGWGGGVCMPERDFLDLNWTKWLARLPDLKKKGRPLDASGGAAAAREIMAIYSQRMAEGT